MVDRFPDPDEESFVVELAAFLEGLVELRELFDFVFVDVLVEDDAEDGEHGIDGGVTEHEIAVVDGDGDGVEDQGEDSLDDGDDETSMDDELSHDRGVLVS